MFRQVPEYDGRNSSVTSFLNKIQRGKILGGWNSISLITVARLNLVGDTKDFVDTRPVVKDTNDWTNLKNTVLIVY